MKTFSEIQIECFNQHYDESESILQEAWDDTVDWIYRNDRVPSELEIYLVFSDTISSIYGKKVAYESSNVSV